MIVALVLSGVGQAFVFNVSNIAAVDATVGAAGLESGMINEVRQVGALVGLALFGALFAALQAAGQGSVDTVFVDALRLPNLILAAVCVLAAAYVARAASGPVERPRLTRVLPWRDRELLAERDERLVGDREVVDAERVHEAHAAAMERVAEACRRARVLEGVRVARSRPSCPRRG